MSRLTRGNLLATLKQLKKIKRPAQVIPSPAVQAIIPSSPVNSNKCLKDVIAQRRALLVNGMSRPFPFTITEQELFDTLTSLHSYRCSYFGKPCGDLFIHWFYCDRSEDRLSKCEVFHLNMLQYFNVLDRVEAIHIRCVFSGTVTCAMQQAIDILSNGKATVDFKLVPKKDSWEHDTIKEAVEYSIDTGKFVYYTHFKGVSRISDTSLGIGVARHKYGELDVLYWCYIMYSALFRGDLCRGLNGVIFRNGVNASYVERNYDCSWCVNKGRPSYHYAGSFQSFDGKFLSKRFESIGLSKKDRLSKLWVGDPYTVEMFLSLCGKPTEIAFAHLGIGIGSYNLWKDRRYSATLFKFMNLYRESNKFKIRSKFVVLTYLYGDHTLLREPAVIDSDVEYVCVCDRPNVISKHWKIVVDPLAYLKDDRLRVAYIKFHPFEFVRATKVLVLDASYQITGSLLPLFENANKPVMLLPHLYRSKLCEELDVWVKLGRMSKKQSDWFKSIVPHLGGSLNEPLFELSASVWSDTPMARLLGVETYAVLEYNGFPSNQMPCSLLAERHFKGYVGSIASNDMKGLIKYKHNKWEPCSKQSYTPVK